MRLRKIVRDKRGSAVVEMALVLPILLVILFAMVIMGISINTKIAVSMSAREAARYYAVNSEDPSVDSDTRNIAKDRLQGSVTASESEFARSFNVFSDVSIERSFDGLYVTVNVTYHQNTMIPGLLRLIGGESWGESFGPHVFSHVQGGMTAWRD